jgi:hypothetical protein
MPYILNPGSNRYVKSDGPTGRLLLNLESLGLCQYDVTKHKKAPVTLNAREQKKVQNFVKKLYPNHKPIPKIASPKVAPKKVAPKVAPKKVAPKIASPKVAPKKASPKVAPKKVAPKKHPKIKGYTGGDPIPINRYIKDLSDLTYKKLIGDDLIHYLNILKPVEFEDKESANNVLKNFNNKFGEKYTWKNFHEQVATVFKRLSGTFGTEKEVDELAKSKFIPELLELARITDFF